MYYYNQNDYDNLTYPCKSYPKATIKSGGCGVVSTTILVNNLIGKEVYTVKAMRDLAISCGARVDGATDVNTLLKAICKAHSELSFTTTSDETKLIEHLKKGGKAIANQGIKYEVFSSAGHFVCAYGMSGENIEIVDPQMYSTKYKKSPKKDRIIKATTNGCIVSKTEIGKASADRSPSYYLVTYTKPKSTTKKAAEKKTTYKTTLNKEYTLKKKCKLYEKPNHKGNSYDYLAKTTIKVIEHIDTKQDKVKVMATSRVAICDVENFI